MAKKKAPKKTSKKKLETRSTIWSSLIRWAWLLTFVGLFAFIALWLLVSSSSLPNTEELENPKYEIASKILSSDNEELGRYFEKNRNPVSYEDLNPYLIDALIATEDERFFQHSGIDAKGTLRAFVYMGRRGGASTVTQQLAKLFFTQRSRNFVTRVWQKAKEWVIAIRFEKRYTKGEIISMYLNKAEFYYNAHGINAASETYFAKDQKDLTIEEASTLIGMLKNPSLFNPKRFPEKALKRRNVVLGQMLRNGKIEKDDFDKLKVLPMDVSKFNRRQNYSGAAPYFRAELTKWLRKLLEEDRYQKEDGSKYDIFSDGLKIYTTIDTRIQAHAEKAMSAHMSTLQEKFFKRWEGADPWTYDATDNQIKRRRATLNQAIYQSARYKTLRKKYLTTISQKISAEIENVRLWDGDIRRMLKAEKSKNYLAQLNRKKDISKLQKATYEQIMASDNWKALKSRWTLFQSAVKKDFNKKRKLKVFAYNSKGYEYKTMSPLDSIKYHKMHLQLGSLSIEPNSGYVKSWVGGVNHDYFKYDHIQNDRQVGSTFKPFLYASAIFEHAISPCQKVEDRPYTIPARDPHFGLMDSWTPKNWDEKYTMSEMTLKEALRLSKNTISTWLMKELKNPAIVRNLAENMGISKSKIPNVPSIALGAADLSVMDMTGAYSTFANNGVFVHPIFVTRIEDKNGKEIYTNISDSHRALPADYNYVMVDMLQHAVSGQQHKLQTKFGGKTGTTNDHVDGWFMGITPDLVTGTWVGGDDPWIKFKDIGDGAGSKMARPYYIDFMRRVERDKGLGYDASKEFVRPDNLGITIECSVYDSLYVKEVELKLEDQLEDEFEEEDFEDEFEEEEFEEN